MCTWRSVVTAAVLLFGLACTCWPAAVLSSPLLPGLTIPWLLRGLAVPSTTTAAPAGLRRRCVAHTASRRWCMRNKGRICVCAVPIRVACFSAQAGGGVMSASCAGRGASPPGGTAKNWSCIPAVSLVAMQTPAEVGFGICAAGTLACVRASIVHGRSVVVRQPNGRMLAVLCVRCERLSLVAINDRNGDACCCVRVCVCCASSRKILVWAGRAVVAAAPQTRAHPSPCHCITGVLPCE